MSPRWNYWSLFLLLDFCLELFLFDPSQCFFVTATIKVVAELWIEFRTGKAGNAGVETFRNLDESLKMSRLIPITVGVIRDHLEAIPKSPGKFR